MVAVMVMTPLHMHHGGATLEIIGVVISAHVLGMFAFAPVVGWATDRFGRPLVLGLAAVVLFAALFLSGTAPAGASYRIGAGLFLLGLGWSLATVAASTLLSESAPLDARPDVQGAADLVMGVTAAAAGALAGVIVGVLGYGWLNLFAAVLVSGVATAAEYARRTTGGPLPADSSLPL
jgi:MFS family permease